MFFRVIRSSSKFVLLKHYSYSLFLDKLKGNVLLNVIKWFYSMSGGRSNQDRFVLQSVSLNLNIILFYYSGGIQVHRVICMLIYLLLQSVSVDLYVILLFYSGCIQIHNRHLHTRLPLAIEWFYGLVYHPGILFRMYASP